MLRLDIPLERLDGTTLAPVSFQLRLRVLGRRAYNDSQVESWVHGNSPARFVESNCTKCHHEKTSLEPSERFPEPPAPKLVKGYHLVREYGCYGCHEIPGYDGPKRIGPDMRTGQADMNRPWFVNRLVRNLRNAVAG